MIIDRSLGRLARVALVALLMSGPAHAVLVELTNVVQLRAGTVHACVVTTGGGVQCWGSNRYGQLGDGTTTDRGSAYYVAGLSSGVLAVSPSSGASIGGSEGHTCAVMVAGGVKCWGLNFAGQLGDGTTTNRLTPVDVPGLAGPAVDVAAGFDHTCALLETGAVQCWGANASGQLGDGTTTPRPAPTNVTGLPSGAVEIAAGPRHTCVITPASDAKCWGANEKGQLGDGTTIMRPAPVDVSSLAGNTAAISPGGSIYQQDLNSTAFRGGGHTCAITASGGAKCWGANFTGQLGDGSFTDHLTPFDVVGLTSGIAGISTGGYSAAGGTFKPDFNHTCAVTAGGGVKCWGSDDCGLLGGGNTSCTNYPRRSATPVDVVGLSSGVASVAVGGGSTCALTTDGRVKCWGLANLPQTEMTGTIPQTITFGPAPVVPAGGTGTVSATGGASGNPVTFTSLTPTTCSIVGTTVSGLSGGQLCTIAANQAGNDYYDPAPQATQTFIIGDKQSQTITFGPAPTIVVGGTGTVSATASSGLPVTFASNTPSICSVSGNTVTGIAAGSCTIAAGQGGNAQYAPAPETTQTFPVNQTAGTRLLTVSRIGKPGNGFLPTGRQSIAVPYARRVSHSDRRSR
jgi:alpha-tubulin suppressor-like RCC1 family protein